MAILAYDESIDQKQKIIYVGIWVIKADRISEKILLKKAYKERDYWPDVIFAYSISLQLFYNSDLRSSFGISNLGWIGGWDGLWDCDIAHIILDGKGNWERLISEHDGILIPGEELKRHFPEGLEINNFISRIDRAAKDEQKNDDNLKWVSFVDKWLGKIRKNKDIMTMFDRKHQMNGVEIFVEKVENVVHE